MREIFDLFDKEKINVYKSAEEIANNNLPILCGKRIGGLYEMKIYRNEGDVQSLHVLNPPYENSDSSTTLCLSSVQFSSLADSKPENLFKLWHHRLGHINPKYLVNMLTKNAVNGMLFSKKNRKEFMCSPLCDACALGKSTNHPIRRTPKKIKKPKRTHLSAPTDESADISQEISNNLKPGQLILIDLIFSNVPALQTQSTIAMIFTDAATKFNWVYFLKNKDEDSIAEKVNLWLTWMKTNNIHVNSFTTIRTDNGSEFINATFVNILQQNHIKRERCPPYAHVHMAERANRTIQDMARCMLFSQNVPTSFWSEAVAYAVYILNRTTNKNNSVKTRYELFFGIKPNMQHLRVFGCPVYARDPKINPKKWEATAFKGRFIGFEESSLKTWKIWNQNTHRYVLSGSVKFDESLIIGGKEGKSDFDIAAEKEGIKNLFIDDILVNENVESVVTPPTTENPSLSTPLSTAATKKKRKITEVQKLKLDHSSMRSKPLSRRRNSKRTIYYANTALCDILEARCLTSSELIVPNTIRQAMDTPEKDSWLEAIHSEVTSLFNNNTFTIMERPNNSRVIGLKWVFKIKETKEGFIERFKVRCTALGNLQRFGYDYLETFSPVVRYSTVRMLLAKAATEKLILHQMDVDTAFLYGVLPDDEPVYVEVPKHYPIPEHLKDKQNLVAKVNKSIYGLKQSPRLWNKNIDNNMLKLGFTKSNYDPCLYIRRKNGSIVYATIFVDDIIIAGNSLNSVNEFKNQLKTLYKCKDLGELNYCLGMEITRDPITSDISLTQKKYMRDILKRFGQANCKPASTPMEPGFQSELPDSGGDNENYPYREVVGSLMYLMVSTRPDIAYAVSYLARYLNNHEKVHHKAANHLLRYIQYTKDLGITYHHNMSFELCGYSDSDWASDISTRKSTTGYIFMMAGGAISWKSRLQPTVALSSSEAEYMALCYAAQEAIALKRIRNEINLSISEDILPVTIFEDNQGAIAMSYNPTHYAKTKHIHIRYHFIRERIEEGDIIVKYINTNDMLADALTKSLTKNKFDPLKKLFMGSDK